MAQDGKARTCQGVDQTQAHDELLISFGERSSEY